MQSLAPYLPQLVLRRLGLLAPNAPDALAISGAVLFLDLTGFTALTDTLIRQGPHGLETVTRVLDAIFTPVVEQITALGGDVMYFAGDAVLALWDAADGDLAAATHQAAHCALLLHTLTYDLPLDDLPTRPTLHIGLSAGQMTLLQVGGVAGRWKTLLAGPALQSMAQAFHLAESGEVVVDAAAWQLNGQRGRGTPRAGGVVLAALDPPPCSAADPPAPQAALDLPRLSTYLPRAVVAMAEAALGGWSAELRHVSVAFVQLGALDQIDVQALDAIQAVVQQIQQELYAYDGSLYQLLGDDKGLVAVIAFGLLRVHEDDAERCVRCCQQIQRAIQALNRACQVGIASGRVFVGDRGSALRCEHAMIGAVMNMAARLMQLSAEATMPALLCTQATAQLLRGRVLVAALPPRQLKGQPAPVPLFYPTSATAPAAADLIGREVEKRLIVGRLAAIQPAGAAAAIVLEGDPGIGKSQLADFARERAQAAGVPVYIGQGSAIATTTPYYPWASVIQQLTAIDLAAPLAAQAQQLAQTLRGIDRQDHAALLNPITLLHLADTPETARLAGFARAEAMHELVVRLLAARSQRGAVVILEDAHWYDSGSWTLIQQVAAQAAVLLLLTSRPVQAEAAEHYRTFCQRPATSLVRLDRLSLADVMALLNQRLGVHSIPRPVIDVIWEKAQGHPFFSEQLAYSFRDAGYLWIERGVCSIRTDVATLRSLPFPEQVQGVIASRMHHLTPFQQLSLKVASVIGRSFPTPVLQDAHPMQPEPQHLLAVLATLTERDFIDPEDRAADQLYHFKHALIQEVAYQTLLVAQRRSLHRQVGELLETQATPTAVSILALHFWHGEQWEKAAHYYMLAGDTAAQSFTYAEARRLYTQGLAALERLPASRERDYQRANTLIKYVGVAQVADSPPANIARLEEAARLLPPDGRALTAAEQQQLSAMYYALGRAYYYYTRPQEAIAQFQHMARLAEDLALPHGLAVPGSMIGRVRSLQGYLAEALPLLDAAFSGLEARGDWSNWIWNRGYVGFCHALEGRYRQGVREVERASTAALTHHHETGLAVSRVFQTMTHWQGGDTTACAAAAQATIEHATRTGDLLPLHLAHGFYAWMLIRSGDLAAAQVHFSHYAAFVQQLGGRLVYADWFAACAAELALAQADYQLAYDRAAAAVDFAEQVEGIFAAGVALRIQALALAALDPRQHSRIEQHLDRSAELLGRGPARLELARTWLAQAHIQLLQGQPAAARRPAQHAWALFFQAEARRDQALAETLLARIAT
jgi:class 3 adenylate cyclase